MEPENNQNNPYEAVLADLEAKKAAIDVMIANIKQFMSFNIGGAVPVGVNTPKVFDINQLPSDAFFGLGLVEATKKFLQMVNRKPQTTHQILDALKKGGLGDTTYASVYSVLSRDANRNDCTVAKVNKNDWGLAEWYPNTPKKKPKKDKAKNGENQEENSEETEEQTAAAN